MTRGFAVVVMRGVRALTYRGKIVVKWYIPVKSL